MEQFKGQPRLPKFAVPKRYDLRLKPDLTDCKFAGSIAIDLHIVADTTFIVLNAAELSVDSASLSFTNPDSSSKVIILLTFLSLDAMSFTTYVYYWGWLAGIGAFED